MHIKTLIAGAALAAAAHTSVHADINIGVLASFTGPGAAIGLDVKRSAELFAEQYKDQKVTLHIVDDASDSSASVQRMQRMISENKIDALVASNTTGPALAMAQLANDQKIPTIAIAPINAEALKSPWVFRASQSPSFFVDRIVEHMVRNKVTTVSFIGFADGWGDLLYGALNASAPKNGLKIVADERYKRPDTSVAAQVLKVMAPQPSAIFIGAAGAPAVLPQAGLRERGYKGPIYQNAVASVEFVRIGGKAVEGAMVPVGTVMVNEQLPDNHPVKPVAKKFLDAYEGKYGADSRSMFAGYAWDALTMLTRSAQAVKGEQPGTAGFRQKLRDNLESTPYVGVTGKYVLSPTDHSGIGLDSLALVKLENGKWRLMK
jgi:branched-chain amino acid transport system substrate-binding protein